MTALLQSVDLGPSTTGCCCQPARRKTVPCPATAFNKSGELERRWKRPASAGMRSNQPANFKSVTDSALNLKLHQYLSFSS